MHCKKCLLFILFVFLCLCLDACKKEEGVVTFTGTVYNTDYTIMQGATVSIDNYHSSSGNDAITQTITGMDGTYEMKLNTGTKHRGSGTGVYSVYLRLKRNGNVLAQHQIDLTKGESKTVRIDLIPQYGY